MICFVVALNSEAENFISIIENKTVFTLAGKPCYSGTVNGKNIVLSVCGIGKVNASIATQALIDTYHPDYIINFGTAGGMDNSVEILKYYLIEKCCQYDFDVSELDNVPIGYIQDFDGIYFNANIPNFSLEHTNVASGDRFNNSQKDIQTILNLNCPLRDMEAGAIGQVCTSNSQPFIMIKGVSDVTGSGTAQEQFLKNLKTVSNGFTPVIINLLDNL